jgi:signal transduction histidine kinase
MADAETEMTGDGAGRILIVDDVADNRAILARRFQRRGFEVVEADSGARALALVADETFDAVLLDVVMPDMNGLEVLRQIREQRTELELPVIMVTGRAESKDMVDALTAGANDYITKPVDFAVALLRVSTQVGRRQAVEQARLASLELSRANEDLERRIAERTAELVASNAQLTAAIAEARAANKAKDEFLIIVSHELRTPLNGMVAMGQMLTQTPLNDQQRKMADIINESADQLHTVIGDLLDMLALISGSMRLDPRAATPAQVARDAAAVIRESAARKGLSIRTEIAPETEAEASLDPDRLTQVLGKLLHNAVKFTESGEVTLAVSRAADVLTLEVRDTGPGFDEETAARLFQPFVQADGSLSRRHGGLGLGLAICRGLVELMSGRLEARAAPGAGACFRITLPLSSEAEASLRSAISTAA